MLDELPQATEEHPDPRDEVVDTPLRTDEWPVFRKPIEVRDDIPEGAPHWWKSEEDATAEFLRSVGARIEDDGTVIRR